MHQHEQLEVWRRSRALATSLSRAAQGSTGAFATGAWKQIVRTAVSVSVNVAEGARRSSDRDFARFLSIAIASAAELRTHLLIAGDAGLVDPALARAAAKESSELQFMLTGLRMRMLRRSRPRTD
ncbi:MAG: four helix bundle protein [Gemmatimonadetes bacterium]|nr:four helix bundle protein [Gemmatimonadota bacterium]